MGLSIGIYKNKLIAFLSLVVAFVGIGYFISQQSSSASIEKISQSVYSGVYNFNAVIEKSSQVLINGKNIPNLLHMDKEFDEFRYKVVDQEGNYINRLTINVQLPQPVDKNQIRQIVYAVHGVDNYQAYQKDSQTLVYEAYGLSPASTFTIVAELPKGLIDFPWYSRIFYSLASLNIYTWLIISIALPVLTLILLGWLYVHQTSSWRLPKTKKEINQLPSDLSPAETEVLLFGKLTSRSIAATLLNLAQRGYIFIVHKGQDFSFGKRKTLDLNNLNMVSGLRSFEKLLLAKIFTKESLKSRSQDVLMRIGRHVFSRKIAEVYFNIYQSITKKGYFLQNPVDFHRKYRNIGLGLFFMAIIGFVFGIFFAPEPKFLLVFWSTMAVVSLIIIKWAPQLPTISNKGKEALVDWIKFRNFLISPTPLQDHGNSQDIFKKYLPYAIALRAEVDWAKRVTLEAFISPDWYISLQPTPDLEDFINGLYPMISFISSSLAASKEPTVQ